MTNPIPAVAGVIAIVFAVYIFGRAVFHMASDIQTIYDAPPVKSERGQCEERGGEWVKPYKSVGNCFSKEAFK